MLISVYLLVHTYFYIKRIKRRCIKDEQTSEKVAFLQGFFVVSIFLALVKFDARIITSLAVYVFSLAGMW